MCEIDAGARRIGRKEGGVPYLQNAVHYSGSDPRPGSRCCADSCSRDGGRNGLADYYLNFVPFVAEPGTQQRQSHHDRECSVLDADGLSRVRFQVA
jgi:hypothetical protein